MKVAYLGSERTFAGDVARRLFPNEKLIPIQPIRNVIMNVEFGRVDLGVVPIENFYNGEVRETLDSLIECSKAKIISEKTLTIVHCLGALKGYGLIKKIYSKDQALEQCSRFLCERYPNVKTIATPSTSEAISIVKKQNLSDAAAIASENALKESDLEILARDICPNNKTRFVVLGTTTTKSTGDDKTFLVIHPPVSDRPGMLYNSLGFFARVGINLEYIQSRPDGNKGYYFYIELDGHEKEKKVKIAVNMIKLSLDPKDKYPNTIKVLGSYKNIHWKEDINV